MCGIAGYFSPSQSIDEQLGHKMLERIAYRGPDAGYLFTTKKCLLGLRRLSIVNVHNGAQPVFSKDRNIAAVFNGEIYNHVEIKRELTQKGYAIKDGSDAEVIPHAFEEWGMDFPSHFNGEFAIALFKKDSSELFLVRDRVGIKPLYYGWAQNGDLVFGSEIKSIFAHSGVPRELDYRSLMQIFTFWTSVDSRSPFQGIHQMESGTICRFSKEGQITEKRKYWDVPFSDQNERLHGSFEECKEAFHQELKKSVALRLRADVEIGTYTSGGIDSSVINYVTYKELKHSQTSTFSVSFQDPLLDESKYQKQLAHILGLKYNEQVCTNEAIYDNISEVVYHAESPLFRTAPIPMFLLSKLVRENGIKVVLTGEGSDEVIWGYDLFREARVRRFWARQPDSKARPQLFKRMYHYLPQFQDRRYFNLTLEFFRLGLTDVDDPLYSHAMRLANSKATHSFLADDFMRKMEGYSPSEDLKSSLPEDFAQRSLLEKAQYLEMKTLLAGYLLSSQGDRMQSAHGVEGRFPYLDHNFIEFMATVPPQYKLMGLKDKFILRETFKKSLPAELVNRPKHAYRAPEMQAFVQDKSGLVENFMAEAPLKATGLFNPAVVAGLLLKLKTRKPEQFTTRDNLAFIQILSTQIFHDRFIRNFDRHPTSPSRDVVVTRDL